MKEYLFKYNDQYTLVELSKEDAESNPDQYIEVPDGAEILTVIVGDNVFYKSRKPWKWYSEESKKWMECSSDVDLDGFENSLWQRESLNDKIATAEVARQDVLKPEDFGAVDNVNHPSHYASGGIECIDAMIAAYGVEAVKAYCKCNAFKYQWRFDKKNGNEDILKAQWYQNKYMELSNEI